MGQKTHPIGFRLGIVKTWSSKWYGEKLYAKWLHEDLKLKAFVKEKLKHAGLAAVEVERAANKAKINIYTARPGIVIGKRGAGVEQLKKEVPAITDAQLGYGQTQVCLMVRQTEAGPEPAPLEVWAAPFEISGHRFTLVCLTDAADRAVRDRLELSILPQALALAAETEALTRAAADDSSTPEARRRTLSLLETSSKRLARVMHAPGELAAAEAGELVVMRRAVSARELLGRAADEMVPGGAPGIRLDWPPEDGVVDTDPELARKALGEILVNALQAAPLGGTRAGFRIW